MLAPLVQGGTNSATSPAVVAAVSVSSIFSSNSVPPVSTSTPAPASSEFMSNRFQTLSVDVSPAEEDDRFVIDDEDDQDGTAKSTLPKNEQALYSLELDDGRMSKMKIKECRP